MIINANSTEPTINTLTDIVTLTILDICVVDPVFVTLTSVLVDFTVGVIDPDNSNTIAIEYEVYDPHDCTIHLSYPEPTAAVAFSDDDLSDFVYFDGYDLIIDAPTYDFIGTHELIISIWYEGHVQESKDEESFDLIIVCDTTGSEIELFNEDKSYNPVEFKFSADGNHIDPVVTFAYYSHFYCGPPIISFQEPNGTDFSDVFTYDLTASEGGLWI